MRSFDLKKLVRDLETRAIKRAVIFHDYNRSRAASALGLKRTTFVMKCRRYGISLDPANPESQTFKRLALLQARAELKASRKAEPWTRS